MSWILIDDLNDIDKIPSGSAFRLFATKEGMKNGYWTPKGGLEYILIDIPGNEMFLSCLSDGEQGNTMCLLKKHGRSYVTGKEVKRMLLCDLHEVYVNKHPHYIVQ